jgi:hypothetical protein
MSKVETATKIAILICRQQRWIDDAGNIHDRVYSGSHFHDWSIYWNYLLR